MSKRKVARRKGKREARSKPAQVKRYRPSASPAPKVFSAPLVVEPLPVRDFDVSARWFVVQTYPGHERLVTARLKASGCDVYLPSETSSFVRKGRPATRTNPVLPRHLFLAVHRFGPSARHLVTDRMTGQPLQGVYDILRFNGREVEVRASDLATFEAEIQAGIFARITPAIPVANGDAILVIKGMFASFRAVVSGPAPEGKVEVEVNIFGRPSKMDLGLDEFEKVA